MAMMLTVRGGSLQAFSWRKHLGLVSTLWCKIIIRVINKDIVIDMSLTEILGRPGVARAAGLTSRETWVEGGCFVLAAALARLFPGRVMGLVDAGKYNLEPGHEIFGHVLFEDDEGAVYDGSGRYGSLEEYLERNPREDGVAWMIVECHRAESISEFNGYDVAALEQLLLRSRWSPKMERDQAHGPRPASICTGDAGISIE
jgi:hypothetical protein